jgi:alkyl hydroperoxide reductase subunit AhpC
MIRVGLDAPPFGCSAVVQCHLFRLSWEQLHENKALVLLFDSIDRRPDSPHDSIAVSNVVTRLARPRAKVAVVCRNDLDEVLGWANRPPPEGGPGPLAFPLIVDPNGRIAALYGLGPDGQVPLWGQVLIDPSGVVRQAVFSDFPVCPSVDELLQSIRASGLPAETDLWN